MYYIRPLLLFSLVVSTVSCSADRATEPSISPTISFNHLAGSAVTRPAGGTCAVTALAVPPLPFDPPLFEPIAHLEIQGICQLKHMGRTKLVSSEQVNFFTGVVTNTATWTAANGDQIKSQFAGSGTTDGVDATFSGVITYVSGTGRFQGVSGTVNNEGNSHATGLTGVGEYRMNGTITY